MKVARIGTMRQPYPPLEYGGTQRSMAQMTVFQAAICAHDVTLYGPADSTIIGYAAEIIEKLQLTSRIDNSKSTIEIDNKDGRIGYIRLRTAGASATGYGNSDEEMLTNELYELLIQDETAHPYDIIHSHYGLQTAQTLIPRGLGHKTLTHNHGPGIRGYREYKYPIICISKSQALPLRKRGVIVFDVMHHGLDAFTHQPTREHAEYLTWVGRIIDKKGADTAIEIAKKANMPIIIAGTTHGSDNTSKEFFEKNVQPLIDVTDKELLNNFEKLTAEEIKNKIKELGKKAYTDAPVIFVGPVDELQKQTLYGNAAATLFPIKWPEPFGRVMIESMACGTPVIGYVQIGKVFCGSVEEVIEDGVTGFHIRAKNDEEAVNKAVKAIKKLKKIDRVRVRKTFDRDWSSERLAWQLDAAYKRFLSEPFKVKEELRRESIFKKILTKLKTNKL